MMSTDTVIYCNGDSFVNGHELGDSLLSTHPGYYDYDKRIPEVESIYSNWYRDSFNTNLDIGKERLTKNSEINQLQKQLAFSNIIQKQLSYDVVNASFQKLGNSQGSITRCSITDLYNLSKKYKKVIAIISTTSINRLDIPDTNSNWYNLMLTNYCEPKDHYHTLLLELSKFYMHYGTDYHLLVEWYKNIILLQLFCKENNIKLFTVTGIADADLGNYQDKEDLQILRKTANLIYDVNMVDLAKKIQYDVYCPGYHFSPIVHKKTAEILCELIQKEL